MYAMLKWYADHIHLLTIISIHVRKHKTNVTVSDQYLYGRDMNLITTGQSPRISLVQIDNRNSIKKIMTHIIEPPEKLNNSQLSN
jgi:hypothetical protein